jgi:hypothetical protein
MAKKRGKIVRHIPFVLAATAAGFAIKNAVDYRNEYHRFLEKSENMVEIPAEIMQQVREGLTLIYWVDGEGKNHYQTTQNSLIKNL